MKNTDVCADTTDHKGIDAAVLEDGIQDGIFEGAKVAFLHQPSFKSRKLRNYVGFDCALDAMCRELRELRVVRRVTITRKHNERTLALFFAHDA